MSNNAWYSTLNQTLLRWVCVGVILFGSCISGQAQTQTAADCPPVSLSVTVQVNPGTPVPPVSPTLTAPVFSPQPGRIGFGDRVSLSVPNAPTGSAIEFSTDNGTSWTTGSEVIIDGNKTVLARSRQQGATSAVVTAVFTAYYRRMLIVGNSIMSHGPAPELGWFNTNGMAASAPDKDFVYLLTGYLSTLNSQTTVKLQSGGGFERDFGTPAFSPDEFNQVLQEYKPDLIVVRLGENVDDNAVEGSRNFEGQFRQLIERFVSYGQPVRVVTTTSVWNRPKTDAAIRKVIGQKGYPLVDLGSMVGQSRYFASQFPNPGVAAHPNDAGMQQIADSIWAVIR